MRRVGGRSFSVLYHPSLLCNSLLCDRPHNLELAGLSDITLLCVACDPLWHCIIGISFWILIVLLKLLLVLFGAWQCCEPFIWQKLCNDSSKCLFYSTENKHWNNIQHWNNICSLTVSLSCIHIIAYIEGHLLAQEICLTECNGKVSGR